MKRVTLPNHNLFYTALIAIDHHTTETSYQALISLLEVELSRKQCDRTLMLFNGKKEHAQVREAIQAKLNGNGQISWQKYTQYKGGPSGPKGLPHDNVEFLAKLLFTLAGPLGQYVFPQPIHNFSSLAVPDNGPDPDKCTCKRAGCQTIADAIRKQSRTFASETSDLSMYRNNFSTTRIPLNDELMARYLWDAAQTYGRITRFSGDEFDHSFQRLLLTNSMMPGITVTDKGCPKAISTIAAILGDLYDNSNYIRTLAALSTREGIGVIKKMIISAKQVH